MSSPFGRQASSNSCNSNALTVRCSSASWRKTASYWATFLPSDVWALYPLMIGGARIKVDFIWHGNISTSLMSFEKKLVNVKSLASKCLLELNRLSAVHAQGKRSFVTRFESCRNNQITTLIQLRALTHLYRKQKPTKNCLLGFLIRKMDNEIHLSTVCVLRVDQTFRLLEESSVDKVGSSEFRQRINGKADDFGLKDTVLV